mmetsp:Transcript_14533/g.29259  ORF Transcript_14533/g.29259 Transcript_14533/m.29259 type:complete len:82 (-) Transcript_14533:451-696(-)
MHEEDGIRPRHRRQDGVCMLVFVSAKVAWPAILLPSDPSIAPVFSCEVSVSHVDVAGWDPSVWCPCSAPSACALLCLTHVS